jgi:hypothetical protein
MLDYRCTISINDADVSQTIYIWIIEMLVCFLESIKYLEDMVKERIYAHCQGDTAKAILFFYNKQDAVSNINLSSA